MFNMRLDENPNYYNTVMKTATYGDASTPPLSFSTNGVPRERSFISLCSSPIASSVFLSLTFTAVGGVFPKYYAKNTISSNPTDATYVIYHFIDKHLKSFPQKKKLHYNNYGAKLTWIRRTVFRLRISFFRNGTNVNLLFFFANIQCTNVFPVLWLN